MADSVGKRIQRARKKLNISQKDFAEKIGVSNVVLSRYESDDRTPDFEKLKLIANLLDVSTDYLLGNQERKLESLFFNHIEGLSDLPKEEQDRIINSLIEQGAFLVERSKKK